MKTRAVIYISCPIERAKRGRIVLEAAFLIASVIGGASLGHNEAFACLPPSSREVQATFPAGYVERSGWDFLRGTL